MAVQIPIYEQRTRTPGGDGQTQARGDRASGAVGAALQGAGEALGGVARTVNDVVQRQDEENGKAYAGKATSDAYLQWQQNLEERKAKAEPGAPNFVPTLLKDYDAWSQTTIKQAPTPTAQKYLTEQLGSLRRQLGGNAISFEADAAQSHRVTQWNEAATNWSRVVAANPGEFEKAIVALTETMPDVGPERKDAMRVTARKMLVDAGGAGAIQKNPAAAKALIDKALNPGGTKRAVVTVGGQGGQGTVQVPAAVEKYATTIDAEGAAAGVDPGFLRRQLAVESGGNPAARNEADVRVTGSPSLGIAQFQPATAKRYGIDPMVPEQAIKGQAAYMRDLLKMFGGDYAKAAAGYNWGEGNVQKAIAKHGDNWQEHIPASTRAYLAKIGVGDNVEPIRVSKEVEASGQPGKAGVGWIDNASVDQLLSLQRSAESALSSVRSAARASLDQTVRDHESQALNGPPPAAALTSQQFADVYGDADGEARYRSYAKNLQFGADVQALGGMSTVDQQRLIERTKPVPDSPAFAEQQQRYEGIQKAAAFVDQKRKEDPIAFAQQRGLYNIQPLNLQDPAALGAELSKRVGASQEMRERFGAPSQVLSKAEAAQMAQVLAVAPTSAKLGYLKTLRNAISDPAAFMRTVQQITPDSPVTGVAAAIIAKQQPYVVPSWVGADRVFTQQDVAGVIIEGEALLNRSPGGKKEDGSGKGFPMPKDTDTRLQFTGFVGDAFAGDPEGADVAYQAARAYYAGKAARAGKIDGELDSKLMKEAVDAVTGGITDYNGNGNVLRPWGMPEDEFKKRVALRYPEAAAAAGLTGQWAKLGSDLTLQTSGDGRYLVRNGTGYLVDPRTGQPVIVDVNDR